MLIRTAITGKNVLQNSCEKIDDLHREGLSRLRFTAAHPQDFTDDVIDALAEMKPSCPYIHLPAQHGSNEVLPCDGAELPVEHFEEIIRKIREKSSQCAQFLRSIIVAFPGGNGRRSFRDFWILETRWV